jgi:hypothetical protein
VSAEEKAFIHEKMRYLGMSNFNAYAIKMATDGYIIAQDFSEVKNLAAELQKIDVNTKQILKHLDAAGPLYAADSEYMRQKMSECWQMVRKLFDEIKRLK